MGRIKVGDIVARKSYGYDILFKVVDVKNNGKENVVTLKGITYRIQADAPESDLIPQSEQRISEDTSRMCSLVDRKCREITCCNSKVGRKKLYFRDTPKESARGFSRPGKVLHIDGDNDYLDTCLAQYKKFNIEATGRFIPEKDQPANIYRLLQDNRPDILVLTGHDGFIKANTNYSQLENYRNSRYFTAAVKEARRYEPDLDSLVIFAGACQSMYNEIMNAGANFASAPYRVLIHALDPVFVCQKIAFTNVNSIISPRDVIDNTITGLEGIGGIQTRGKYRDGYPLEPYNQ